MLEANGSELEDDFARTSKALHDAIRPSRDELQKTISELLNTAGNEKEESIKLACNRAILQEKFDNKMAICFEKALFGRSGQKPYWPSVISGKRSYGLAFQGDQRTDA